MTDTTKTPAEIAAVMTQAEVNTAPAALTTPTARREHLDGRSAFRPVEVGVSPGGVVWVAYRPEHVAPMKLRLAALRTREATRARLAAELVR